MAKPFKLYTDVNISNQVALQLRNKGVDVLRCEEVGMAEASDINHIRYATETERIFISFDQDLAESETTYSGMIFVQPHLQGETGIGKIVKVLLEWHQRVENEEITVENFFENQLCFIS